MPLFSGDDRIAADAIAALVDCNPFLPERVALERQALGSAFIPIAPVWHAEGAHAGTNPNTPLLRDRTEALVASVRRRLADGAATTDAELSTCRGLVHYLLWLRYEDDLFYLAEPQEHPTTTPPAAERVFDAFARDVHDLLRPLAGPDAQQPDPVHLFAVAFQARRAFHHVFRRIFGASLPIARLRAAVWQSVFTDNPARYRRALFDRMRDIPTLVTGASGTGKELVARAIAFSRFLPFDPHTSRFAENAQAGFHPIHIAAFSPSVVESELFGHRRGAYTGADQDRVGWFERCGPHGTVFVDELGELDPAIQVKLLRVLQNREVIRIGDSAIRRFEGKLVAATHRNLVAEIHRGRFREDLYYRLCADSIELPTLQQQLADCPDDLHNLVLVAAQHVVGNEEAPAVAAEVEAWIDTRLGRAYPWPGNMRELEQCVRSVVVHGDYQPTPLPDAADGLAAAIRNATLTADELLARYVGIVYATTGSVREVSRRTGLDRRVVRRLMGGNGEGESGDAPD
jgi:hypothetical protein